MPTGQTLFLFSKETEVGRRKKGEQHTNLDWLCSEVGIKWAGKIASHDLRP